MYLKQEDEKKALFYYCQKIINLCNLRIKSNVVEIILNGKQTNKPLYKFKREKYFPEIIEFDVNTEINKKRTTSCCIPLLIYNDLLECFLSNQNELEKSNTEIYRFSDPHIQELIEINSEKPVALERLI